MNGIEMKADGCKKAKSMQKFFSANVFLFNFFNGKYRSNDNTDKVDDMQSTDAFKREFLSGNKVASPDDEVGYGDQMVLFGRLLILGWFVYDGIVDEGACFGHF